MGSTALAGTRDAQAYGAGVTNAGAVNPEGLARALRERIAELGLALRPPDVAEPASSPQRA
mgnify:CR=1 FL=1